jgi:TP901 family phage tail tape measure protein
VNQTIGSLRVALGLDSAQFNAGLKQVQSRIDRFAGKMRMVGAAISAVGTGIAVAVKGQLNAADEMSKAAQKFGVPIKELSTLKYAAELSGVSLDQMGTALGALSRNMVNSEKKFASLGISVRDANGEMRPTADVLGEIADVLKDMPDGAEKSALAMSLMGKSGRDMIPLLNQGSDAIRRMQEEARAMGLEISQETGTAAEQFNDNLTRLSSTVSGFVAIITANLAPVLARISDLLVGMAAGFQNLSPEMQKFLSILAGVVVVLGPALIGLSLMLPALSLLVSPLGLVAAGVAALVAAAVLAPAALDAVSVALTGMPLDEQLAAWKKFGEDLKLIWNEWPTALKVVFDSLAGWAQPGLDSLGQAVSAGAKRAKDWFISGMEEIWTYLSSLPAKWFQAGADMVQGLIDGLNSKWQAFKDSIFRLNNEADNSFQENWDFGSPSRVTTQYGQWIAEGLAIGVQQGAPQFGAAMSQLSAVGVSQMETMSDKMQGLADGLAQGLTGIFEKLVSGAKITLQDVGQIVSQIAKTLFIQPFMSGLQSGLKGLFGGFAGGFATGGYIPPGQWGITGEAGPEIVSGGRSGATITPMTGGGQVTQNFNITAPDPNAFRYSQRQIQRRARSALGTF